MVQRPQFVVPVHDLDLTGRDLRATLTKEWLDSVLEDTELRLQGPEGFLDVHVSKTGNDVLVRGVVHVDLETSCARCLEPVQLGGDIDLTLLLRPSAKAQRPVGSAARPVPHRERAGTAKKAETKSKPSRPRPEDEYEFTSEEADTDLYEGDEVVLDGFVREAILLEEPIFPLCSDACEGIRPPPQSSPTSPGEAADAKPATDPRFARIAELVAQKQTKKKE